jgi:hypothetical protein
MQDALGIEQALETLAGPFKDKYNLMKDRLLNVEYEHWAAGFPEGNNHGRGHITRVLENLDHLVGSEPLAYLNVYELFLAMMAILYHDIGLLRQRERHGDISKELLEGDNNDAYIINKFDKEIISAAVVSHSASKDINAECSRFSTEEIVGQYRARPRVVAALVRLADELDEDYRRADVILQQRLNPPSESAFFWLFCQRIRGVRPNLLAKRIDFNFAPEINDVLRYGPVPGGKTRHFIAFCADKFEKINRERVTVNEFLPPELQYAGIHVDVKPLTRHRQWKNPRTFVFNDNTTSLMFIQSFPELLDGPAKDEMRDILDLMHQGNLTAAESRLERLAIVAEDLPIETQMRVLYDQACVYSLQAATLGTQSFEIKRTLDRAVDCLIRWFRQGQAGAFDAIGKTAFAEVGRMANDGDLSFVRLKRQKALKKEIPDKFWPNVTAHGRSRSGGCIPFGTMVDTPDGSRRVELLRLGDNVLSFPLGSTTERVTARIDAIMSTRATCCVRLGNNWVVTQRQPVYTTNGWLVAGELKNGDRVMDNQGAFIPVENPVLIQDYFEVFQLNIDDPAHNYFANGLLCRNGFYKK